MPRAINPLVLSPEQRSELQRWVAALGTPQQVALRCRIILAVAAGKTEIAIASENGAGSPVTMQPESRPSSTPRCRPNRKGARIGAAVRWQRRRESANPV